MERTDSGMVRRRAGTGSLLFFLWISASAFGFDLPLTFHPQSEQDLHDYMTPSVSGWIQRSFQRPAGDWAFPQPVGPHPVYGIIELAGERRLLFLDREGPVDRFYNRLRFDSNGNGSLLDEEAYLGRVSELWDRYYVVFPPINTTVPSDGGTVPSGSGRIPYRFRPYAYCPSNLVRPNVTPAELESEFAFAFTVAGYYAGTVNWGGGEYTFAVEDSNANGRFFEPFSLPEKMENPFQRAFNPAGDRVYVTTEKRITVYDAVPGLKRFVIGREVLDVIFRPGERKVVLKPSTEKLYPVRLGMELSRLLLDMEGGRGSVVVYGSRREVRLPEGKYRLHMYHAMREDAKGALWRLDALGKEKGPLFTVREDAGRDMAIGEPFRLNVETFTLRGAKWRGQTGLRLWIRGSAGELVTDLQKVSGKETAIEMSKERGSTTLPKEPTYRIVDKDGIERTQTGKFEYG